MVCPASYLMQFGKVGLGFPRPIPEMVLTLAPSNLPSELELVIAFIMVAFGRVLEPFSRR